jgi:glycerol uptake facilitator-like aquaporin
LSDVLLARALAAEALGAALLVTAVIGSGIMGERLAGGNDAVALLANTGATAAALYVLIALLGPISGAHFNPVVTVVLWARGDVAARAVLPYGAAQVAGAAAGAMLANAMFALPLVTAAATARSGTALWLSEIVATFTLVLVILGLSKTRPAAIPAAVALTIAAAYWFTASTSFANPAVTLARSLSDTFAGIDPRHVPAFVVAQAVGGALALGVAGFLFGSSRSMPREMPGAARVVPE